MAWAWTDERIATLRKLVAKGLSGGQIAAEMGAPSRNSVMGKAARIGLTIGQNNPTFRQANLRGNRHAKKKDAMPPSTARPSTSVPTVEFVPGAPEELFPEAVEAIDPPHDAPVIDTAAKGPRAYMPPPGAVLISIMELRMGHCRWPYDTAAGTQYCGRQADGSFCLDHQRMAYVGTKYERDPDFQPKRSGRGFDFATLGVSDA